MNFVIGSSWFAMLYFFAENGCLIKSQSEFCLKIIHTGAQFFLLFLLSAEKLSNNLHKTEKTEWTTGRNSKKIDKSYFYFNFQIRIPQKQNCTCSVLKLTYALQFLFLQILDRHNFWLNQPTLSIECVIKIHNFCLGSPLSQSQGKSVSRNTYVNHTLHISERSSAKESFPAALQMRINNYVVIH